MSDVYGAIEIPPSPLVGDGTIGDPLLDAFGAYLTAVVNAHCSTEWGRADAGTPAVRGYSTNNPEEGEFNERDLPHLFVWREASAFERMADEYQADRSTICVLWVPSVRPQIKRTAQSNFANLVAKTIDRACYYERDRAWLAEGDDESAAIGSSVVTQANLLMRPMVKARSTQPIVIQLDGGSEPRRYVGAKLTIDVVERLQQDLAAVPSPRGIRPAAVDIDFYGNPTTDGVPTTGILVGEYTDPP